MSYPASLELDADLRVANWRPLVSWLLAIPHLLLAQALQSVGQVISLVSWFIVVFTGKLPAGLADFQCLVIRYSARALSYAVWLREPYPPFEFTMAGRDPGTDPLRVDLQPMLTDRNRLTVGLRLIWAIPTLIVGMVLSFVASLALIVAFFAVLFTGRWPEGLRRFVLGCGRYYLRMSAYLSLLTDEYPPLSLD